MFCIYVNKRTGTFHRGGCEDCNYRLGKKDGVDLFAKWRGPFELLEDAQEAFEKTLKRCRKCRPTRDW